MSKTDLALEGGAVLAGIDHPVLAAVMAGAKLTLGAIRQAIPSADDRVAEFIAEEIHQAVFTVIPEINKRVKQIEEQLGDRPSATQATQIWTAFVRGFASAEGQKRKLLLNALVNAFDPCLYQQSMTTRLLSLIDDRDYPDLSCLMRIRGAAGWPDNRSLDAYHMQRLLDAGLLLREEKAPDNWRKTPYNVGHVTALGGWLLLLIRNPNTANL